MLRKADLVKSTEDFRAGGPVLFFEFYGPTARLIQDEQFWVATLDMALRDEIVARTGVKRD
jgi:hypothetical protein